MAPRKKVQPLEITDTGEIPIVSVDIDTSYEAMIPDPVPAYEHVANNTQDMLTFPAPRFERLLPIVSTIMASVALGALILGIGIMLGADL